MISFFIPITSWLMTRACTAPMICGRDITRLVRRVLEDDGALKRKAGSETSSDFSISMGHPHRQITITRS